MKRKYKVLVAAHSEKGKTYVRGQTLVSSYSLHKLFVNAFEDLGPVADLPPVPEEKGGGAVLISDPSKTKDKEEVIVVETPVQVAEVVEEDEFEADLELFVEDDGAELPENAKEVTKEFPGLLESGWAVHRQKHEYYLLAPKQKKEHRTGPHTKADVLALEAKA